MYQLTARMIRAYKGAAASILMLFIAEGGRALTQAEMRRGTGYHDEAIHDALGMLREDGLVVEQARYTWALPGGLRQLPLGRLAEPHPHPAVPLQAAEQNQAPDQPELVIHESRKESNSTDREDDSLIHASQGLPVSEAVTAEDLCQFGFYGLGIDQMLALPGLTLREVRYHVQNAPSLGAALARIRKRQAVPAAFEAQVDDEEQDGRKYVEGKYADFICH
jgi:biotin operon repressor